MNVHAPLQISPKRIPAALIGAALIAATLVALCAGCVRVKVHGDPNAARAAHAGSPTLRVATYNTSPGAMACIPANTACWCCRAIPSTPRRCAASSC